MKRALLLLVLPLLTLGVLLPVGSVRAENPDWSSVAKAFKSSFKTKNSLKQRRKAVKAMAKSKDHRGIKELLKVIKTQRKHASKLRKEWVAEEEDWKEKTDRLQAQVDKRAEQGDNTCTDEEDAWLGLTAKWQQPGAGTPRMFVEKGRIEKLFKAILQEEDLVPYILRNVSHLVNTLEGDEQEKGIRDAATAAKKAKGDAKEEFIRMLAFITGERATKVLEAFAKDTDPKTVVYALEALGRQNSDRGMEVLIKKLEDPRWQIRGAALQGLSFFLDARVMDALLAAAKKEEGVLRRKYYATMARICQEQVPGTVEAWESFWRENREDFVERWKKMRTGEPILQDPPDIPIDTSLGSTSFYGIRTDSKHIIFVVDISGSMRPQEGMKEGEGKIDIARKELKNAIKSLVAAGKDERGDASFNIVNYSTGVEVYKPKKMIKATAKNMDKAFDWIEEKVQADGMTNIYDALEQAFYVVSDKEKKNVEKGADTIFLMTDGAANRGKFIDYELILHGVKEMNKTRKLTIHTIGVGPGHNRMFLMQLAAQNDGQYLSR